jgi:hypothetical protein
VLGCISVVFRWSKVPLDAQRTVSIEDPRSNCACFLQTINGHTTIQNTCAAGRRRWLSKLDILYTGHRRQQHAARARLY